MSEVIKKKLGRLLYSKDWVLQYNLAPDRDSPNLDLSSFSRLYPPKGRIWADPFIYYKEGRYHIFLEDMSNKEKKGVISLLIMDRDGKITGPVKVLEEPFHLSYPFIFEHSDGLYMVPESKKGKGIRLYRCTKFPNEWMFEKEMISNIEAADSTIFRYHGIFWLFTSVRREKGDPDTEELHLFWTEDPVSGRWTPHRKNPVVKDPAHSRPAGNILYHEGAIVRPTQYFIDGFAFGMKLCRIEKLDEESYEETVIMDLNPGREKNLLGIHTLNFSNGLTIIDARVRRRRLL